MIDVVIRPARIDEHAALEALMWRASLIWEADRAWLLANRQVVALPIEQIAAGRVHVAAAGESLLGFSAVLPLDGEACELDGLFVDPAQMRQGVGARLVDQAARLAVAEGASVLSVIANPGAVAFYSRCGFEHTGLAQTENGPAPAMRKSLPQS